MAKEPTIIASLLREEPDAEWPKDATRDPFCGDWHIYQRKSGHRTSTDDMMVAAHALELRERIPQPTRYLDIGCGIGSVLLMTAHALRPAESMGVEAQPQSALMAARSVDELPTNAPDISVSHGDLRDLQPAKVGMFDLITGSPPYFPMGTGVLPADSQRRACRFELRGGVEAYCETASRSLSEDGIFVLVFQTLWADRVERAISTARLRVLERVDARMRADHSEPFLSTWACGHAQSGVEQSAASTGSVPNREFFIRSKTGELSTHWLRVRRDLGFIS